MKPPPFEYLVAGSLEDALAALVEHGSEAKLLAGGQSLVPMLNFRLARPGVLIDLNRLTELAHVRETTQGGLLLGAMTRHRRLERDPLVAQRAPLLAEATPWVAHPQIRNRGTIGGSLAHADPAAEFPTVMVALRATFHLRGPQGPREVPAADFFVGLLTTALAEDEILTAIELPPLPARTGCCFLEVARRHGDYAQVGVAALVRLDDDGRCAEARCVYLSVGDGPAEAREATGRLTGERLTVELLDEAAAHAAAHEIDPQDDIHASAAFKRHLARVLGRRALVQAAQRAGEARPA